MEFERQKRVLSKKGHIIDLYTDYVKTPNGTVAEWDFIKHKGAAAVIPVKEDGKILMVRQWRNALDRYTLEIPAGGLNGTQETFATCAARELEEETGYKAKEIHFLISVRTTVAFCNERIDIFVASQLQKSVQHLDPDEFVEVEEYTIEELLEKIKKDEIQDSKTISALYAYYVQEVLNK